MIPEEMSLAGKVALVTGTGRGWTPILAAALAEAGADVAVAGSDTHELDEAVQAVKAQGRNGTSIQANLIKLADVRNAVEQSVAQLGGLSILVNNTQVEFGKPFSDTTEAEFDQLLALNTKSLFLCCQEAGRHMRQNGKGRIVNIISGLAERGMWNSVAYCATQGAALQITRALSLEWGRQDIRVNAIGTGFYTVEEIPPEQAKQDKLARYIPSRRRGHPRDMAGVLVFLSSDICGYIAGNCVYVDGGLMSHP